MKHAIVIGASSGLGFEVARILLDDGWHIGVAARRSELLLGLRQMCPDRVETETIDVTDEGAVARLESLIERVGGMQLFFYASGIGRQNIGLEQDTELSTVATNALGFTRMVGAAYRYMADNGGGHIDKFYSRHQRVRGGSFIFCYKGLSERIYSGSRPTGLYARAVNHLHRPASRICCNGIAWR